MPGEIEFLSAEPPSEPGGEPPVLPAPTPSATPRRARIAVIVGLVALVVGGLVARVVTSGTPRSASPARSPLLSASASHDDAADGLLVTYCYDIVQVGVSPVPRLALPSRRGIVRTVVRPRGSTSTCVSTRPATCPATAHVACSTTNRVPADFLAAVRARYRHARVVAARTNLVPDADRLWARSVVLQDGYDRIRIVVEHRGRDLGESGQRNDGSSNVARVVVPSGDHVTVVEVTSPAGTQSDLGMLSALAGDPRLDALS